MNQEFLLSQSDGRPMYQQIMEQIKWRITAMEWNPGFRLPSIRELAVSARVSVITVKRAYQELENEGVIFTQQGKGSFVAEVDGLGIRLQEKELELKLADVLETARSQGLDMDELIRRLRDLAAAQKRGN
ncbi:MAG: GntR family transcriptional regulator [Lysobacterales bacterium]|jgi:GntR family transcriptional regulator